MIPGYDQKCAVKKLTFDIGSGSTKYYYAQVNRCAQTVTHIYNQGHFRFPFKQYLLKSTDNRFSHDVQKLFLSKMSEVIKKHPADIVHGVATSAFRTAANGLQVAKNIEEETGMQLQIISQKTEGFLGYKAVQNKIQDKSSFLYWDIGGGSMQMIAPTAGDPMIYEGKIGSASFKNMVLKKIFKGKRKSPNPIRIKNIKKIVSLSSHFAKKTVPQIFLKAAKKMKTIGIGGVHQFSILKKHTNRNFYSKKQLRKWLTQSANKNDRQVGGEYAQTDITNIALVLGYMDYFELDRIEVKSGINMAYALLFNWKPIGTL